MFGKNWFLIAKLLDASGCKHLQLEPSHSSSIGSIWTAFLTNHGHGAGTGSSADTRYSLTSSGPKKQNSNKNRHIQTHKNPYSLWMSMDTGCKLWIEPFQITRVNKWVQSIIARAHQTRNHKQCKQFRVVIPVSKLPWSSSFKRKMWLRLPYSGSCSSNIPHMFAQNNRYAGGTYWHT